jgi:hypothetical protein
MARDPGTEEDGINIDRFFRKSATHSVVTTRARNYVAKHPEVDWATAPHMVLAEDGQTAEVEDADGRDRLGPQVLYDFAGFRKRENLSLEVAGFVGVDESLIALAYRIMQNRNRKMTNLCVMPNSKAIEHFLEVLSRLMNNRHLAPDNEEVADYYARQPSITAVNNELTNWLPKSVMGLKFITIKQLVDEIVTPGEVLNITEGN